MYNLKKVLTAVFASVGILSFAQEAKKSPLTLSGSVDAFYQTYLTQSDVSPTPFGTSFAEEAGFALGMANTVFSYDGAKTGMVADLAFGNRGVSAVGGDDEIGDYNFYVNQLYAYWNVSEATTLTLGRFNTYLGYEVISPTGNFNYSTSYLFSNGPFSHVGLKADFALSDDFSLMLAVMNVTDTNVNVDGVYALGAQLGYSGQYLNFYYDGGAGLGLEIDYTGGFDITDKFFLGINAAYQMLGDYSDTAEFVDPITGEISEIDVFLEDVSNGFYGVALYPQYAATDNFSIGLRGEYFGYHVEEGEDLPSVFATTLTGSYSLENLTIKPEVRLDAWSNDEPYFDNDGAAASSLAAFTLAAIYSF